MTDPLTHELELSQPMSQLRGLLKELRELREKLGTDRWIPLSERSPGEDNVIFTDGEHSYFGCVFKNGTGAELVSFHPDFEWSGAKKYKVTHWRPLPEPPTASPKPPRPKN